MSVHDYHAGMDIPDHDPNAPDTIPRKLTNKIAKALVHAEEMLQLGDGDVDMDEFYNKRGDVLDILDDPDIQKWIRDLQVQNRCPFRRFAVR